VNISKKKRLTSAREAAFYALYLWQKKGTYLADTFHAIRQEKVLHTIDLQLAQEIAFGVVRRFHTLEALIKKGGKDFKIKLKIEAKLMIKMAVYQLIFMDRVPVYAVVCESVELSKRFSPYQAGFINGFLRKFTTLLPITDLQDQMTEEEWYSLPHFLIAKLQHSYPHDWQKIAEASIKRPKMTFLLIDDRTANIEKEAVHNGKLRYYAMKKDLESDKLFASSSIYTQNPTPGQLMEYLAEGHAPQTILDVCSSPGGKLIIAHLLFPDARLIANEYAAERKMTLEENIAKYQIKATLLHEDGRNLKLQERVDLIIIDAPCSNTGVLHKKPEAKYRLDDTSLEELKATQKALLDRASTLIDEQGAIWYMTCSVLMEENGDLVQSWVKNHPDWIITRQKLILPDGDYRDGGYAVELKKIAIL
jgi:16S rRNA (cytosine967-C5)-methyltransferase